MITQLKLFIESIDKNKEKIVYRGSWTSNNLYDGMFFSEDKEYARIFGHHVESYKIMCGKVLNLNKYNDICREKIPEYYNCGDLFYIHSEVIKTNWDYVMDALYVNDLDDVADEFQKELEECDTIYGSDAGETESKVWYVKRKENITRI